jgi:hypothetical protein
MRIGSLGLKFKCGVKVPPQPTLVTVRSEIEIARKILIAASYCFLVSLSEVSGAGRDETPPAPIATTWRFLGALLTVAVALVDSSHFVYGPCSSGALNKTIFTALHGDTFSEQPT